MCRQILLFLLFLLLFHYPALCAEWTLLRTESPGAVITQSENGLHITFATGSETAAVFGQDIGSPLLIEDLKIAVPVKTNTQGIAAGVEVACGNITFLVPGKKYTGSKNWEILNVPDLYKESYRIAGLLQTEYKTKIDLSRAYVRQVVLYVENSSSIEIQKPQITGYAGANEASAPIPRTFEPLNYAGFKIFVSQKPAYLVRAANPNHQIEWVSPFEIQQVSDTAVSTTALTRIRFIDGTLMIDDVPTGIRAIEYRGESLEFLRKLEFNAVWLKEPPSEELRSESQKAGIWLICPPPSNAELAPAQTFNQIQTHRTATMDSSYNNVLAWNLGDECSAARYQSDAQRAQILQNADRQKRRPLLCTARSGIYDYSRTCEILMMPRVPLLSSLDMLDLRQWQKVYPTLARPDTSFWATIQTQPSAKLAEQWSLYEGTPAYIVPFSYEQIQVQIYGALAAGCRGVLYLSETPLTNQDPETEFRRNALELANWELQLTEEWFAAGKPLGETLPQPPSASPHSFHFQVIQSGRNRLLVPTLQERRQQIAIGPAVTGNVRYVISGIPETYNAYHLVPGRLMPLESKRVAGGMQIELEECNLNSLIFFGEDDAVYAQVGQRAKLMGGRCAYLACRLAESQLQQTDQVLTALKKAKENNAVPVCLKDNLPLVQLPEQESMLKTTKESLEFAKQLISRTPPDYARAFLQAERSTRGLRFTARDLWDEAMRHETNSGMTPVSVSFATLPLYVSMYQRSIGAKLGNNRLLGGDFEAQNLEQNRWEAMSHRVEGVMVARRDLVPQAGRLGGRGLQLVVVPSDKANVPQTLETIPLWIATPPMTVRNGEMLCATGWIRIPNTLTATQDGLMVFDSYGGEELALRFTDTGGGWKQFVFYRLVPADGHYYLFFALNGFGEVHIDDVQVAAVQFAVKEREVETSRPQRPSLMQRMNPLQYLPPVPGLRQ